MAVQPIIDEILQNNESFQAFVDTSQEAFDQPLWPAYLEEEFTGSLDWNAILAVAASVSAATVIDFSGDKPLITNPTTSKLSGSIPKLANTIQMSERDVRKLIDLQDALNRSNTIANQLAITNVLFGFLNRLTLGPHKTMDMMFFQAISTGSVSLTAANNPMGIPFALDWGIEKSNVSTVWSDPSATPIADIKAVIDEATDSGVQYDRIMMSRKTFNNMVATADFREKFGFNATQGGSETTLRNLTPIGLEQVNTYFSLVDLPEIEIVNARITIENRNGTKSNINPFADNRVTFAPLGPLGTLTYTYSVEGRSPDQDAVYATSRNVLLKTRQKNGTREMSNEFNGFPVINTANNLRILQTDQA